MADDRTYFDLDDDEMEELERNPEDYEDVIENSNELLWDLMYPDEDSRPDDELRTQDRMMNWQTKN